MTKRRKYQIPSPEVVRFFGVMLLALDAALLFVAITNFDSLNWLAYAIILGTLASIYFPIKAIQTGDPEWVLLDLIFPA